MRLSVSSPAPIWRCLPGGRARAGPCIGGKMTGRGIREDLALLRDAQAPPSESALPVRALAQQ